MPETLKVRSVSLEKLKEDPANPRSHDERNIAAIKGSLAKFGQVEPLVIQSSTGMVIGGNGRLAAMRELGWKEAQVVYVDMDDAKARMLSITLNRTGELAEWNLPTLSQHLHTFGELRLEMMDLGWTEHELEPLLAADWKPAEVDPEYTPPDTTGKRSVQFPKEYWNTIQPALAKVRGEDKKMTDAEAIVIAICGRLPPDAKP